MLDVLSMQHIALCSLYIYYCYFYMLHTYSPFHTVQITDLLEFLHEYCKEKSETFTEF